MGMDMYIPWMWLYGDYILCRKPDFLALFVPKLLFNYLIGGHIQLLYKRLVACTGLAHAWHNNTLHPPPTPQSAGVYLPVGSTTSSENYGYVCGYMGIISFAGHHTYGSVCPP